MVRLSGHLRFGQHSDDMMGATPTEKPGISSAGAAAVAQKYVPIHFYSKLRCGEEGYNDDVYFV